MPEAEREVVGGNNPPSLIDSCTALAGDISGWLAEHPAITTEEDARQAKLHLDRGKLSLKDMEDERGRAVKPLNDQVKFINESYRPAKVLLGAINEEVAKRIAAYIRAEEEKKQEAIREAARRLAEAESRARESERREREAADQASTGELGVDLKTVVGEADAAARDLEKAGRSLQRAEKEAHVKVGGGFSRATSLRKVTTFHLMKPAVESAIQVIRATGLTDEMQAAILKAAKAHYEEYGDVLPGCIMYEERKI